MSYVADIEKLKDRFADATAVTAVSDGKPDSYFTQILEEQSTFMDSYLARRYSTPVVTTSNATVASVLEKINLDLADYQLLMRNGSVSASKQAMKDEATTWLEGVASGKFMLPGATSASTVSRNPHVSWGSGDGTKSTTGRLFTRETQSQL